MHLTIKKRSENCDSRQACPERGRRDAKTPSDGLRSVIPSDRLCENSVHGSTWLTTNGCQKLQIKHLAVRPELRRRAPKEFSHSLANARDLRKISPGVYPELAEGVEITPSVTLRLGALAREMFLKSFCKHFKRLTLPCPTRPKNKPCSEKHWNIDQGGRRVKS